MCTMMIKHRPSRASLKAGTPKYMMPKSCASLLERAVSRWREPLQALPQEGLYLKPFFKPVSNLHHKLMQPRIALPPSSKSHTHAIILTRRKMRAMRRSRKILKMRMTRSLLTLPPAALTEFMHSWTPRDEEGGRVHSDLKGDM